MKPAEPAAWDGGGTTALGTSRLRAATRLPMAVLHGLVGLVIVLFRFPSLDTTGRQARVGWWSARLLKLLGIRLVVQGHFRPGAKLIVANHVSWLDIATVHAVCPEARFVSKADVREWPLVGKLVAGGGTLYIEREKRRDALRVVHQMADALRQGDTVAVFPEGTTGAGHDLLPFHANLLQAAIASEVPVQPVVLRYSDDRHPVSVAAQFIGQTTLAQSMWRIAGAQGLTVHLTVLSAVGTRQADRRALSEHLRELIGEVLKP